MFAAVLWLGHGVITLKIVTVQTDLATPHLNIPQSVERKAAESVAMDRKLH